MANKIIAIACSTGGPKALQEIIPKFPSDLGVPVLIVQHMPEGFTKSFSERMNALSYIDVTESIHEEYIKDNHAYIAKAGKHLNLISDVNGHRISHSDEDLREGVKPCANYMFESLTGTRFDEVICVVLTGMGRDGTEGIINLSKKKKVKIIIQDEESSVVYGMPGSILKSNLNCEILPIDKISERIVELLEE